MELRWSLAVFCPLPGFRICVEKLKYKTLKHPPHLPVGQQAALSWWGRSSVLLFKGWTGRLLKLGSDNTGPEGFAHPCVSLKRCLYLTITYLGSSLKPAEKSLFYNQHFPEIHSQATGYGKKQSFDKLHSVHILSKVWSWRPALRIFSDLVFQRNVFWSCKYLEARIKSKSEMLCWSWIFRDKGQLFHNYEKL